MKHLLLIAFIVASPVFAKTIYFGGETEVITLAANEETLLKFPSDVRTISRAQRYVIQPADPSQPNYSTLTIRPRFSSGQTSVTFILNDGTIIRTKVAVISTASPEKIDNFYEFKPKEALLEQGDKISGSLSEIELMKAMIRGDDVPGYEIKNVSRLITPGFKGVCTSLTRIYTGNRFNGYIFEITHTSKQSLLIDIKNLTLGEPNQALLSHIDESVLDVDGKRKATLRIVAKPTSVYSKLILPVEVIKKIAGGTI